jgi:hypothetical protein
MASLRDRRFGQANSFKRRLKAFSAKRAAVERVLIDWHPIGPRSVVPIETSRSSLAGQRDYARGVQVYRISSIVNTKHNLSIYLHFFVKYKILM